MRRHAYRGPEGCLLRANITQLELLALDGELNLADGHARQSLTASQQEAIDRLPELFALANRVAFAELERRAHETYLRAVGQLQAMAPGRRLLSAYSSSVVMGVVARCLADSVVNVGLVHPTFDNIPDILKSWNLRLIPLDEAVLTQGIARSADGEEPACVFITTPNNPTGTVIGPGPLEQIARRCAARRAPLVLDTSFRGFDPRAQYDTYDLLDQTGVEYVVIEDTGKLWPASELKLGLLVASENCQLHLEEGMSDVLLSVSPLVLALVTVLAQDAAAGGLAELQALIGRNRKALQSAISTSGAVDADRDSRVSVARVRLPARVSARAVWCELRQRGVHVLPCGPFHWAQPSEGDRYIRVALARDTPMVSAAASAVAECAAARSQSRLDQARKR